jgi:peptidyl-prolyl cis-trans isomerase SurA
MRARVGLACWALLLAPGAVAAQQAPQLVDRVVAVVGSEPILLSDVQERVLIQQSQNGLQLPPDSAARTAMRRQMLQTMIDDEVLYQKARRDTSITVTEAEVLSKAEDQARSIRGQYRSEGEFRTAIAASGFGTPEEWRRWLTEQQRRAQYEDAYLGKLRQDGKLKPANVTLPELRDAFREWQQSAGPQTKRPAMVFFKQIVVAPRPTPEARAAALVRADSVLAQIRRGADFETLARRFSDDPGTREVGGDLGWFRRGTMVDAFEKVAFATPEGGIAGPVLSPFGYHIIKVEHVQPGEIKARHILFVPAVDSVNLAQARLRADTVYALLRAGASFDSLVPLYADTAEQVQVDSVERAKLLQTAPIYAAAFDSATVGRPIPPFAIGTESPNHTKYVVAILTAVEPERDYTFDDVRDQLRGRLSQQKSVQELLRTLRNQTYVSIRM